MRCPSRRRSHRNIGRPLFPATGNSGFTPFLEPGDGRSAPISPNVHQGRRGCARGIHLWPVIPPNNSGLDPEVAAITFEVMIGALRPDLKREDQQTLARVFLDRGHPPAPLSVFPAVGQNAQLPGHWAYFSTISASAFGRSATAAKAAKPRANAST